MNPKRVKYFDGRHSHPLFQLWKGMMRRCYDINKLDYKYYGGRGIKVDSSWHDFWNFVKDVSPRPNNYQLDRINNNKEYSKDNCRWVSSKENSNNTRANTIIKYADICLTLSQFADILEIKYSTLRSRVRRTGTIFNHQKDRKLEKLLKKL